MRHLWFCLLFLCAGATAATYTVDSVPNPRPVNGSHVADPDGILGAESAAAIDRQLDALERTTGAQVAVVAVDSIGSQDVFGFAQALFERWGIGDRTRNDGLLVLLVKDQRTVRMHTGYGLEGVLPDVVCKRIQREEMVPAFKDGRYGEGLLAGVGAVARILRSAAPDAMPQPLAAAATDDGWQFFEIFGAIVGGIIAIVAFAFKATAGHFSDKQRDTPRAMRWTAGRWLLAFVGGPIALGLAVDQIAAAPRTAGYLATLYAYFMLVAAYQAWRQRRTVAQLAAERSYRDIDALVANRLRFWLWMALLFPLPFLPHYIYQRTRRSYYRNLPRNCPRCQAPMRRLSEAEEDAYLSKAQQMEEQLHAADYDVWRCTACEATTSLAFSGTDARYEKCPKCDCLAYLKDSERTLVAPTYSHAGKGERVFVCRFCGHRAVATYAIAMLVASSSSSSSSDSGSSGSSSGGSDWGGGDSGGGGASSSW